MVILETKITFNIRSELATARKRKASDRVGREEKNVVSLKQTYQRSGPIRSRDHLFNIHDITGIKRLTKLRVKFSDLNEHKFRHNFDCVSPICDCGQANEDNEHFLLHCPLYDNIRQDLFGHLEDILEFNVLSMDSNSLCNLLLFGKPDLDVSVNKMIIEETIRFIENTKRL